MQQKRQKNTAIPQSQAHPTDNIFFIFFLGLQGEHI
jgi:hypothetical protein